LVNSADSFLNASVFPFSGRCAFEVVILVFGVRVSQQVQSWCNLLCDKSYRESNFETRMLIRNGFDAKKLSRKTACHFLIDGCSIEQ